MKWADSRSEGKVSSACLMKADRRSSGKTIPDVSRSAVGFYWCTSADSKISFRALASPRKIESPMIDRGRLRSPAFALLSEAFNNLQHRFPPMARIDMLAAHAHADFLFLVCPHQLLQKQVLHLDADEDAAVGTVLLLWTIG